MLLCTTSGGRAGGCSCVSNSTLLLLGLLLALVVATVGWWWWPWTFLQRGDPGSISVQEEQRGTKQPDKLEESVWVLQPGGLCKAHQEIPHPARSTLTEKSRMK